MTLLAPTLQAFFTERLQAQRQASQHTIAAYRDTMRLLLAFATERTGKAASRLELSDLDVRLISAFLDHLENERHNTVRTRNVRLAAIRSLYRYAALRHPEHAEVIERVLAIPAKRFDRALVSFLTKEEVCALLATPDRRSWTGRRDHTLLLTAIQTGLRVSELTGLRCEDVRLGVGAHLLCHGKNRKERAVPLTTQTVKSITVWLRERNGRPEGSALSQQPRQPAQPRRGRMVDRQAQRQRRRTLPHVARQARHRSRPAAHHRDDAPAIRHQHRSDRALARTRAREHHPHLPARRPSPQAARPRPHHTTKHQTRAIPSN